MKKEVLKNIRKIACISMAVAGLSFSAGNLQAQESRGRYNYGFTDHAKVAAVNIFLNGLVSGIGAARNHQPFFENFAKGAFAGFLITSGNYMVSREEDLAWPSKFVTSIGSSIAYNTSRGRPIFDTFGMEIGPLYLSLERRNSRNDQVTEENLSMRNQSRQGNYGFNWYLIPGSLAGIADRIFNRSRFSLENTLRYGTPIFHENATPEQRGSRVGYYGSNVLILNEDITPGETRHELVHAQQVGSYRNWSSLFPNKYLEINNSLRRHHIDISTMPGDMLFHLQKLFFGYKGSLSEWEAKILSGYPRPDN